MNPQPRAPIGSGGPLKAAFGDLLGELPMLFSDRVLLLSLELQRAGLALAEIVLLIVVAAILGVTAWLVLWGAAAAALFDAGVKLGWVLVLLFVPNFAAACFAGLRIRKLAGRLSLPATMRRLTNIAPGPDPRPADQPVSTPSIDGSARAIQPVR